MSFGISPELQQRAAARFIGSEGIFNLLGVIVMQASFYLPLKTSFQSTRFYLAEL
jgi:hypothetical protein